jgi:hypothetical protein
VERTLALLQGALKVTHVIYAGPFNQTSEVEYRSAREADRETRRRAGALGADRPGDDRPINGLGQNEAFRQLERSLRDLADTAAECKVKIGLEPLHYVLKGDSFLFTLSDAMDIIERINHPALGVFIDVYHIWHEPGLLETLKRTQGRIVGCHICDFRQLNRSIYDRVLMRGWGHSCPPDPEALKSKAGTGGTTSKCSRSSGRWSRRRFSNSPSKYRGVAGSGRESSSTMKVSGIHHVSINTRDLGVSRFLRTHPGLDAAGDGAVRRLLVYFEIPGGTGAVRLRRRNPQASATRARSASASGLHGR